MKFTSITLAVLCVGSQANETRRLGNKKGICKKDVPNFGSFVSQVSFIIMAHNSILTMNYRLLTLSNVSSIIQLLTNAGGHADLDTLSKIGSITDHIAEAADASATGATVEDGKSGDIDFPHGNLKVLAVSLMNDCL